MFQCLNMNFSESHAVRFVKELHKVTVIKGISISNLSECLSTTIDRKVFCPTAAPLRHNFAKSKLAHTVWEIFFI